MRTPLLLFTLVVMCAAGPAAAPAQQAAAPPAPSLDALAAQLYQEIAALKGLAAPGPPPPVLVKSRAETRRFIEQELDRRYSAARVEAERKGMVAWGLIPPDYDLRRLFVDLLEEQIAAYYDPRGKVMVLGDWLPPEQQQAALVHELVHALQDREISLDAFLAPHLGQGDQLLARQALIEGEAVAITIEVALKAQGGDLASLPDLGALRSMVAAGAAGTSVGSAPKFLRDLLIFPYVDGLNFVFELRKRQPWSAIAALYRDPPRSTTQILNPEKRFVTREDPRRVVLPDLGTLAEARLVTEDELGEFALRAVLALHIGESGGRAAAAGWRGDHYRIWEDTDGRLVIAYLLAMESEAAANAFALTYTKVLERRHPALTGNGVPGRTGSLVTWRDGGRAFAVEQRGAELLILEQMPGALADGVREAVWRSRSAAAP